ncbi:hypothetical protein J1N35_022627 [Gossypium stocksii]|uniref:RNase H type-1 domain-containing protein n=1 Tax=Gossypium stocksii TaxID=47602 RepID=A0A9D4A1B5_9ROSI|nr:hypothetical protein J1N35_022627 [Gossypium stocksii]
MQCFKQFRLLPCPVFSYQNHYVERWKISLQSSGNRKGKKGKGYTGANGKLCVNQKRKGNEVSKLGAIHYWLSKEDVERILRIPLARTPHDDLLVWGVNQPMEFLQWLTWASDQFTTNQNRLFCCGLWAIWGERNKRVYEQQQRTGQEIAIFIKTYMAELNGLEKKSPGRDREHARWSHPPNEFFKLNFDGAYDTTLQQSTSGIVARNEDREVLLTCSEIHYGVSSAFAAEAIACRNAVQIGVEQGWPKIIIEGDSLSIIKKCISKNQDRSSIEAYIYDIKQILNRSKNFMFHHTPRSANAFAHLVATETLKRKEETYLVMSVPGYAENQRRIDWRREPD